MDIKENQRLATLASMRVGGPARFYVTLNEVDDFSALNDFLAEHPGLDKLVLGACTNIVISDDGFDGVAIKNNLDFIKIADSEVEVGAGMMLPRLALVVIEEGLAGLERVGTVPGTVGGAIWGNAEANGQSISDSLVAVRWGSFTGQQDWLTKKECQFGYRSSIFKTRLARQGIILSAKYTLTKGKPESLRQLWQDDMTLRKNRQPSDFSCGCFFKNIVLTKLRWRQLVKALGPEALNGLTLGDLFSTGRLLDALGLKGSCRGGACISQIHANFLVNAGQANAQDVYNLFTYIKSEVKKRTGIVLENEVQFAGNFTD